MEQLYAYAFLWAWDLAPQQLYGDILDELFLESPNSEILLELEELVGNYKDSFLRIKRYFEYECDSFSKELFGKTLFLGLEKAYFSNTIALSDFAARVYEIWKMLPDAIEYGEEPFFSLCYADDPLSWGDEKQTRELYESAFLFYKA